MKIRTGSGKYMNETGMSCGWSGETGTYALAKALNNLAAGEADCLGVEAQILIPPYADNRKAYAEERCIRRACQEQGVELKEARITKNPLCIVPAVVIIGAGYVSGLSETEAGQAIEGPVREDDIVLVKWVGMEGMLRITQERGSELRQRFAPAFMRQIQNYEGEIFAGRELEIARAVGITAVRQITEGGVFAALWDLAKEAGTGLEVDLKRISILQETIEVCEYYRLNPYQLTSAGSFLALTQSGELLTDTLRRNQIEASVIGRLTKGNDKTIYNGGDVRCLDRPAPDEIYKIFPVHASKDCMVQ